MATSQAKRNETSVRAIREKATWTPERAVNAAAATPAVGPNVRHPTHPTTGIVRIPMSIETAIAERSETPRIA